MTDIKQGLTRNIRTHWWPSLICMLNAVATLTLDDSHPIYKMIGVGGVRYFIEYILIEYKINQVLYTQIWEN